MLYFWRLLFAMWPWLPIAESKIKGNNCVKCFWLNLTINFFPQQYFRTKMSIWLHLYASLSCCRAVIKKGLRGTGPGVLTWAPLWEEGVSYLGSAFPGKGALSEVEVGALWSPRNIPGEDAFSVAHVGHCASILFSSFCNCWSSLPEYTGVLMLFLHQRISTNAL